MQNMDNRVMTPYTEFSDFDNDNRMMTPYTNEQYSDEEFEDKGIYHIDLTFHQTNRWRVSVNQKWDRCRCS